MPLLRETKLSTAALDGIAVVPQEEVNEHLRTAKGWVCQTVCRVDLQPHFHNVSSLQLAWPVMTPSVIILSTDAGVVVLRLHVLAAVAILRPARRKNIFTFLSIRDFTSDLLTIVSSCRSPYPLEVKLGVPANLLFMAEKRVLTLGSQSRRLKLSSRWSVSSWSRWGWDQAAQVALFHP